MSRKVFGLLALGLLAITAVAMSRAARFAAEDDEDLDELRQKAIKAAVKKVAPYVVQIETSGGIDVVRTAPGPNGRMIRTGYGPTTGVIVSADGYIITSAFNFINKPSAIRIAVPGQKERLVATVVATDQTRMLTLLKVDAKGLPVPTPAPKDQVKIGHTALAVGRTLTTTIDEPPSASEGIVSAVNRVWGKAFQTDAKVSPVNYGGPLVDLSGRIMGILVPASPRAEGETAGFEWYDSGIGFAIPLEDINKTLPRLKQGKDLKRGVLGVNMASQDMFGVEPKVGAVQPGSAADRAGFRAGDVVKSIDGHAVASYAQLLHQLGSKYEGDVVTVKVLRGKEEKTFEKLSLGSTVAAFGQAFLGILSMRDDPKPGVEIRFVYPKSPAETAGLKEGDRILQASTRPPAPGTPGPMVVLKNRDQLLALVDTMAPGMDMKLEVLRKAGKKDMVSLKLGDMIDAVPEKLPEISSVRDRKEEEKKDEKKDDAKKDDKKDDKKDEKKDGSNSEVSLRDDEKKDDKKDDDKPKVEMDLFEKKTATKDHTYWVYVPDNYKPEVSYALMIWFHPVGKGKERDIKDFKNKWDDYCDANHVIMLMPLANNVTTGWVPGEAEFVLEAVKFVTDRYNVDKRRIVAHGMGIGGQMSFYMGFHNRNLVRGVATVGASLDSNPKERLANQPLAFFVIVGDKDLIKNQASETHKKLQEYKFSSIYREMKDTGNEYPDNDLIKEIARWIDSLDRI